MRKNEDNRLTFFSELQAYIEAHGHLPNKHVVEKRMLLSLRKYLRKKIKAGTAEDWMVERFEAILAMRSNEHTGGAKTNLSPSNDEDMNLHSSIKSSRFQCLSLLWMCWFVYKTFID